MCGLATKWTVSPSTCGRWCLATTGQRSFTTTEGCHVSNLHESLPVLVLCASVFGHVSCMVGVSHCRVGVSHCMVGVSHCRVGASHCMVGVSHCMVGVSHCMVGGCIP